MNTPVGRIRTRAALSQLLPGDEGRAALAATDLFGRELDHYAEIIAGPGQRPAGFMTRGEDASFTERARVSMIRLGMPEAAVAHHRALAEWFEHARAFFKMEWTPRTPVEGVEGEARESAQPSGGEALVACYFRRRPMVDELLGKLVGFGVGASARELVMDVAGALEKDSVHFVSAAFRPGHPIHHKLYFSQWVEPATREAGFGRLLKMFRLLDLPSSSVEQFTRNHPRMLQQDDITYFVSISFDSEGRIAKNFKIDYPEVAPARAAVWRPEAEQLGVIADAEKACALAGTRAVSYLGVRFAAESPVPSLKYYCDVPAPGG